MWVLSGDSACVLVIVYATVDYVLVFSDHLGAVYVFAEGIQERDRPVSDAHA